MYSKCNRNGHRHGGIYFNHIIGSSNPAVFACYYHNRLWMLWGDSPPPSLLQDSHLMMRESICLLYSPLFYLRLRQRLRFRRGNSGVPTSQHENSKLTLRKTRHGPQWLPTPDPCTKSKSDPAIKVRACNAALLASESAAFPNHKSMLQPFSPLQYFHFLPLKILKAFHKETRRGFLLASLGAW